MGEFNTQWLDHSACSLPPPATRASVWPRFGQVIRGISISTLMGNFTQMSSKSISFGCNSEPRWWYKWYSAEWSHALGLEYGELVYISKQNTHTHRWHDYSRSSVVQMPEFPKNTSQLQSSTAPPRKQYTYAPGRCRSSLTRIRWAVIYNTKTSRLTTNIALRLCEVHSIMLVRTFLQKWPENIV